MNTSEEGQPEAGIISMKGTLKELKSPKGIAGEVLLK